MKISKLEYYNKQLQKKLWNIKPQNLKSIKRIDSRPILVVTAQKSGTHLLLNILNLSGLKQAKKTTNNLKVSILDLQMLERSEYLHTHEAPSSQVFGLIEQNKIRTIFNYRDPRDVLISNYFYLTSDRNKLDSKNYTGEFLRKSYKNLKNKNKVLEFMIGCNQMYPREQTLDTWFYKTRGLLHHPNVFKTSFESLVGVKGGGSDKAQLESIDKLFQYLSIKTNISKIIKNAFDPNQKTFRKGQIGDYKNHMNKNILDLFNKKHGQILKEYGYKSNLK